MKKTGFTHYMRYKSQFHRERPITHAHARTRLVLMKMLC